MVHGIAHLRLLQDVTKLNDGLSLLLELRVDDVLHAAISHVVLVLSLLDQIVHLPYLTFIFHFDQVK